MITLGQAVEKRKVEVLRPGEGQLRFALKRTGEAVHFDEWVTTARENLGGKRLASVVVEFVVNQKPINIQSLPHTQAAILIVV